MLIKTLISFFVFFSVGILNLFSQTYIQPNFGLKIPETLEILKVELSAEKTVIYFSIENRIEKGEFCADKNIYILYPDGTRIKLVKAEGIPQCPDYYKFKNIGEKLAFTLTFPPLKQGSTWIDLIEDCKENCFSFYGILLESEMNEKIDEAVGLLDKGDLDSAISKYKNIITGAGSSENGITGSLYSDLISLLVQKGYKKEAEEWYNKLVSSDVPRLQLYLNNLNSRGIKF
jgi:hypothetical protein